MAATGFTPIQLYYSTTASAAPSSGNLANGELAINITDGKLYYKDNGGTVRVLAGTGGTGVVAGSNTQVQFNNNGVFGASANMTFNGTRLTVADFADASLTSGRVTYATTGGNLTDSANLTFDGTNLTLGGGTANGVAYLNGSKVLTTGSALTFDGTTQALAAAAGYGFFRVSGASGGYFDTYNSTGTKIGSFGSENGGDMYLGTRVNNPIIFLQNNAEGMRLTSTGLGIGTSSPSTALDVASASGSPIISLTASGAWRYQILTDRSSKTFRIRDQSAGDLDRVILDQGGNLGLGVTPSAWAAGKAFEVGSVGNAIAGFGVSDLELFSGAYYSAGYKYAVTGSAVSNYTQQAGVHKWYTAPSGTAGNAISFTQAMTLDASGRLGVGTTNPSTTVHALGGSASGSNAINYNIRISTGTAGSAAFAGVGTGIQFDSFTNNNGTQVVAAISSALNSGGSGGSATDHSGSLLFYTKNSASASLIERGRFDSEGNLLVGTTSTSCGGSTMRQHISATDFVLGLTTAASGITQALRFAYGTTAVGSVTLTGSTASYNTSSDYRLKENVQPMTGALAKVSALKPCTYTWKADGSAGEGFIAHELAEVVPQCVTGEKDAVDAEGNPVYQGIDTSFLAGLYAAAIQELKAELDSVKAELASLKGAA